MGQSRTRALRRTPVRPAAEGGAGPPAASEASITRGGTPPQHDRHAGTSRQCEAYLHSLRIVL
jgi:hypothetical protein